jgi:hypothetical protein
MNSSWPQPSPPRTERPEVEPLTAVLARLHVTVSKAFLQKLDRARDALSHSNPGASIADILEAGLDLVLERDLKRKGFVSKPQKTPRPTTTDRIPASVRRAVFLRDGFKCQYRLPNGEICGSTHQSSRSITSGRGRWAGRPRSRTAAWRAGRITASLRARSSGIRGWIGSSVPQAEARGR